MAVSNVETIKGQPVAAVEYDRQHDDDHAHAHSALAHHFDNMEQQRDASSIGMWVFIAQEIMFFGGLFAAYIVFRAKYPDVFAEASRDHLSVVWGSINTVVLICSSLTMALAVHAAQIGNRRSLVNFLVATMFLGTVFLGIKAVEYNDKFNHHLFPGKEFHYAGGQTGIDLDAAPEVRTGNFRVGELNSKPYQAFFWIYFAMTGLHALHMIIGIGILAVLTFLSYRGAYGPEYNAPIELTGLYWHFVDIVWIFLFPLLYLIGGFKLGH